MYKLMYFIIFSILFDFSSLYSNENALATDQNEQIQTMLLELVGTWVYDLDFVGEYLRKGAELQKKWCGYSWPESEIKRREKFIRTDAARNGCPLIYIISYLGGDSLELKIENNRHEKKVKIIYECKRQQPNLFVCKQSPPSDQPFVFRYDGQYFYLMLKMTPNMMKCQVKSSKPSEVWIAVVRFKRSEE